MSAPMIIRAGMVKATLLIANTFKCSRVSHPTFFSMVVANGAILNQT
jgi:hypothetical protein